MKSGALVTAWLRVLFLFPEGFLIIFLSSQALSSRSDPGAVPQEERKEGDGGERDAEYQETLRQNGLQGPSQLKDNGTAQKYTLMELMKSYKIHRLHIQLAV